MRRFIILLLLIATLPVFAQQYNNEWINFNQTYYKFKVGANGLYRIPRSTLDAAGIGNTGVQFFELWRNGQRVRLFTTTSSGPLPSNGYMEFWGEGNDGKPDKALYRISSFQHTSQISLITDTAAYFLSVNTDQSGLFYSDPGNADNARPVEPYFIYTAGFYYKNVINPGFANIIGEYVYSSAFDKGEFWSSDYVRPGTPMISSISNLQPYPGGPTPVLRFGVMGDALNSRSIRVSVGGTVVKDTALDFFSDVVSSNNFPASLISSGTATVQFENNSGTATDRMVASFFEVNYPRQFNFSNARNFKFNLPASGTGYHLAIASFDYGTVAPILYDLATGERIIADISVPGTVTLFLQPGPARELVLVSQAASNVSSVGSLTQKKFKSFMAAGNQGDYLIITNKALFTGTHSNNPISD
ncbi:MAG TPA: hypothetical protein VK618_06305, partial [Flavitalea sp.]|nr:hypothetical protein [Flavitalea sp.]